MSQRHTSLVLASLSLLTFITLADVRGEAAEFAPTLSLQGFTGLLNTPNALVTPEGHMDILFSDQIEPPWRDRTTRQENYLFSIGFFSIMELGGRVTEAPGVARDLSGNVKFTTTPLFADYPLVPTFAVGVQDIGGGSPFLRTSYAVVSETIGPLRLSFGYGNGPDRMKGLFGGGELRAFDWLHLTAEYDTTETNVGLRVLTPEFPSLPISFHATLKTSLDHHPGQPEIAVGLRFPLGRPYHAIAPVRPEPEPASPLAPAAASEAEAMPASGYPPPAAANYYRLAALRRRLMADGFLNVRVGSKEHDLLVVEYENSRFNHNELDAMGLVLGRIVVNGQPSEQNIRLIMRKHGIRTLMLEASTVKIATFFADATAEEALAAEMIISDDMPDEPTIDWEQNKPTANGALKAEAVLYPAIKTFVASDVGLLDYYLSMKTDSYLSLWTGAALNARFNTPVSWSDNFEDGKEYRRFRDSRGFERLMLFQAVKPVPNLWLSFSGGMILTDLYGTLNEAVWSPGGGAHRFRLKHMYAEQSESRTINEVYLGSYRYSYAPLNLTLEATVGRFYNRDRGVSAELKRFFGDTAFSVYYKNSRTEFAERIQIGGITFSFPLTPRRDMPSDQIRVRGTDEWSYSQETEIVSPGKGGNWVGRSIGLNPQVAFNIERVFQNRDRLSASYIKQHLLRFRDAWLTYGEEK